MLVHEMVGEGKGKEVADAYGSLATKHSNISNVTFPTSYTNMLQFRAAETQIGSSSNYTYLQVHINIFVYSIYTYNFFNHFTY